MKRGRILYKNMSFILKSFKITVGPLKGNTSTFLGSKCREVYKSRRVLNWSSGQLYL